MPEIETQLRRDAMQIARSALQAADAGIAVLRQLSLGRGRLRAGKQHYRLADFDSIFVVAVGKAAVPMAAAMESVLGEHLETGLVVTKHGHVTQPLRVCQVRTAAHPVPDEAGLAAAQELEQLLRTLHARDLLLVAISGGASALLPAPLPGLTLAQKQKTTGLLLRAGADIHELNAVRKHLSFLKGGRMAALAYPATIATFLLSDVIGDPLDTIGSGPTAPDHSTYAEAIAVVQRYSLQSRLPKAVWNHLAAGAQGLYAETPKPGDLLFQQVSYVIAGSNRASLAAAAAAARKLGYRALILSSTIAGETRDVARVHAEILHEMAIHGSPAKPPACLLAGGETTVTVTGQGSGGRNQEFALAAAHAIDGLPNVLVMSLGTDGTDGPTDAAGAIATGNTLARAQRLGLDHRRALANNDSYPFFAALGDLVKTGPTGTNVMDIHLLLAR